MATVDNVATFPKSNSLEYQKPIKTAMVPFSYTRIDETTVMIESSNAFVAYFTMMCS
jgi:hypothetical protein